MTIFRRRSKNTVLQGETPDLEASASPSAYWLADFEQKQNVVLEEDSVDDAGSMSTNYSNSSSHDSLTTSESNAAEVEALVEAFEDFSVKLDDQNDNVVVSLDLPPNVQSEDLNVQVDDGILRVSSEVSAGMLNESSRSLNTRSSHNQSSRSLNSASVSTTTPTQVEQAFQLDEQSLDIRNLTANLSPDGHLTITAPKKAENKITLMDSLEIAPTKPPRDPTAFRVILDVPGVHLEDLHVSYTNGKLRLAGNRHFGRSRAFKRTIPVDTIQFNADKIQSYLYRGQLTVLVPKRTDTPVSRNVEIQEEESQENKEEEQRQDKPSESQAAKVA